MDNVDDYVEMGVKNPMDKYSNYNQQKIEDKEMEFINPLAGLRKGTEESSSTLSASPPSETPAHSASPPSETPTSETLSHSAKIRSIPILSVLSDVSSDDEYSPSPIGIHIKTGIDIDDIDFNEQTPLPVHIHKSKLVEVNLQTPEPEIVNSVSLEIEEEKKDDEIDEIVYVEKKGEVDIEKGEEVGRARLWRHMLYKDESLMEKIIKENIKIFDGDLVLPCAPTDQEKTMYYNTGRLMLIIFGVISTCSLSAGMILFAISAKYFYWFVAVTAFFVIYLGLSYFGVSIWGKDFILEEHQKKIEEAKENNYFPSVDIFLPVCGEPLTMLDNTWKYVSAMDYPNFSVHVLDDGKKDEVKYLAEMYGFNYIRRGVNTLKKAGNLRHAFTMTSGEIISIFDADFCPRPEFLTETTMYFQDENLAICQTPQFFRWRKNHSWVEAGASVTQELFYRMVQVNRNRFGGSICVGTCGVYRRSSLEPFGGTAAIGFSEDVHTGFNCVNNGQDLKYIPVVLSMGACPDEPRAFFMQQYRWCMGSTTLLSNPEFWKSNLTKIQKLCFLGGMMYYSATALAIFTGPLPGLLLIWIRPSAVFWYNVAFAVPSLIFSFFIMKIWAKQPYGFSCQRVRIIQSYSHLFAIKDKIMGSAIAWVPTGGGASSKSSSQAYDMSVKLMLVWTTVVTFLIVGGSGWFMTSYPWYHFVPTILLAVFNLFMNISTIL